VRETTEIKKIVVGLQKGPLLKVDILHRSFESFLDAVCTKMTSLWEEAVSTDGKLMDADKLVDFAGLFTLLVSARLHSEQTEDQEEYSISREIYEYYRMVLDELWPLLDEALLIIKQK